MKRLLLFILVAIIALPGIARNFNYTFEGQTLSYKVLDEDAKTVKVDRNTDLSGELIIPQEVSDGKNVYTVIAIGQNALSYCKDLVLVEIPESVTSIGSSAFRSCSFKSISIPKSVTYIGSYAFGMCLDLEKAEFASIKTLCNIYFEDADSNPLNEAYNLYINGNEITDLRIPEGVTTIKNYAFSRCMNLKSITIPASVSSIGKGAFSLWGDVEKVEFASIEDLCRISFSDQYSNPMRYSKDIYILAASWRLK